MTDTSEMDRRAELSEFLRNRRARLKPEQAGIQPFGGRRRVPGLRREELAYLAGMSVDYYIRLEQGKVRNVSEPILEALTRALSLSEDERAYLRNLVKPSHRRPVSRPKVLPGLLRLLDMAEGVPAYVVGHRADVLAWNGLASAVFTDFAALSPRDRNWARMIFLNRSVQAVFADWTSKGRDTVAYLRVQAASHPGDAELAALVGELSVKSDHFRTWWAAHHVRDHARGRKRFIHPLVGEMTLDFECLRPADGGDQTLVVYTAEAGAASERALRLLANWGADAATGAEAGEPEVGRL
ncbi:helix-turn-helix transcriptional regulator [Nonomuraea sp. NBC_00507]|uniref:helix-turn-helix transcriptional regulator n=1 Tax=Nonomuraea sp. NBC_00507 TaxID=2976002 RepID=UPI002E19CD27